MPCKIKGHNREKRTELMPIHHLLHSLQYTDSTNHQDMEDSSSSCVVLNGGVSDHGAHAATSPQIMPLSPDSPAWMLMHELSGQTHIPPRQRAYAQFRILPLLIHHARCGGPKSLIIHSDLSCKGPFLASTATHIHVLVLFF